MKFSFCHSFMLSYLSLCSFCLTCFLPRSLAQGRHPSECYDRLVGALCIGICVCVGAVFYIVCLWPHMSFMVCVRAGAELRDSFSVCSFISFFLRLCELLPACPTETGPSWSSPLRPVAELRDRAYNAPACWGPLFRDVLQEASGFEVFVWGASGEVKWLRLSGN